MRYPRSSSSSSSRSPSRRAPAVIEAVEQRVLFAVNATQLSEGVVASTLPATVSELKTAAGKVTVEIDNDSGVTQSGRVGVYVYASAGGFDPQSYDNYELGFRSVVGRLTDGDATDVVVPVKVAKGKVGGGSYNLYALVADADGQYTYSGPGPALAVTPPNVSLSFTQTLGKLSAAATRTGKVTGTVDKLTITNSGSDPFTGTLELDVYASSDGYAGDGTEVGYVAYKTYKIPAGKSITVPVKLKVTAALDAGTYTVFSYVVESNDDTATDANAVNPTFTITG